jgi:hypothetical protein
MAIHAQLALDRITRVPAAIRDMRVSSRGGAGHRCPNPEAKAAALNDFDAFEALGPHVAVVLRARALWETTLVEHS